MRARNLKPAFFKNEDLGSADPLLGTLFQGLWCAADREGRLEDRPLRLCVEIFPYRREVTEEKLDRMLTWLDSHDFIRRYEIDGNRYVQVLQFLRHQRPHSKEKASEIPPLTSKQHRPRSDRAPTKVVSSTDLGNGEHALTPSSLTPSSLTPDSPLRGPAAPSAVGKAEPPKWMADFRNAYPPRIGDQAWRRAERAGNARIAEGAKPEEFIAGAKRYAAFCEVTGKLGTEFVKQAATFLGPDKPYLLPWDAPASKAETRYAANVETARRWAEEK